jgi:hypothetical protein
VRIFLCVGGYACTYLDVRILTKRRAEYFRGLANPVGVKVGPTMAATELVAVVQRLNPANEPGKVTLITRYGADKARGCTLCVSVCVSVCALALWLTAAAGRGSRWRRFCRAMFGRCRRPAWQSCGAAIPCMATLRRRPRASRPVALSASSRCVTRGPAPPPSAAGTVADPIANNLHCPTLWQCVICFPIGQELRQNFEIHKTLGSHLGGVHFELTGDSVTGPPCFRFPTQARCSCAVWRVECTGGSVEMDEADLSTNYQTQCDPRLNYTQSMDMAFLIARHYERERQQLQQQQKGRRTPSA